MTNRDRFLVRADGPNYYGCEFFSIVDTQENRVHATWTVVSYALEQCDWLNEHATHRTFGTPCVRETTS